MATTKLFVGNIPPGTSGDEMLALFSQFGSVVDCVVLGSFGFVHMESEEEAKAAVKALHNYELHNSRIRVELSTPSTQGKMKSGSSSSSTKIFVGNLKSGTTDTEVRELFEQYGTVTEAVVISGYGFVHMQDLSEAKAAIKDLKGYKLNGMPMSVELSTKDTQGKSKVSNGFQPAPDRSRPGPSWSGTFRGRGRGMNSRFDPYSSHGMMGRGGYDQYGYGGSGGSDPYAEQDPYALPMGRSLAAPPSAQSLPSGNNPDVSFARDLLRLYSENPTAFDAYARDPTVRRSLKLDGQESADNYGGQHQAALGGGMGMGMGMGMSSSGGPGMSGHLMAPMSRRGNYPKSSGGMLAAPRAASSQMYMSFE